jgi:serine/threonine protein kinase
MGEVYRARDTRLGREVAVKVLPPHLSESPELKQRFEQEAKAISQLTHPHICTLYDVGNQDGVEYLVMEYLEGETLADRLANGPLPLAQTLRYGAEIADALDKAHRQGIVHRDLKPGNVMLTKSGVKLLDFGLAKVFEPPAARGSLTALPTKAALTQEGTILGTFQYMAPEQLEGQEADGHLCPRRGALRDGDGEESVLSLEPGVADHVDRPAADLNDPAHVAAGPRPRGENVPCQRPGRPLAKRKRPQK